MSYICIKSQLKLLALGPKIDCELVSKDLNQNLYVL